MTKKASGVILLIVVFLGSSSVGLAQKLHPKLKKKEKTFQIFLLIPPKINLMKDTVKGGEGMMKEAEEIEKGTQKLIFDLLKAKGFNVIDGQVTPDSSGSNEELRYALADIQTKYDQIHPQLQDKQKDVEKGRFTLGDQVTKLSSAKRADALIFIRGAGMVKTAGKAFLGALAGGRGGSQLDLTFAIVDAQTGDVLYFDKRQVISGLVGTKFHETPEKALKKPVEKALKKIPPPGQKAAL